MRSPRRASTWLWILVAVHLAWGVARIPGRVWGRRLDDIARYREYGAAGYFLDPASGAHMSGAGAVQWLLDHSTAETVVLWRGEQKGAFELASGLIAPRWLVHADQVPPATKAFLGRPIVANENGTAVLVGRGDDVVLEFR